MDKIDWVFASIITILVLMLMFCIGFLFGSREGIKIGLQRGIEAKTWCGYEGEPVKWPARKDGVCYSQDRPK